MHGKQYTDEQNTSVRAAVREIVERDFGGTKATAAAAFGVTAASLGDFLNGKKGVGNKLLAGLAAYTGSSSAALLGEQSDDEEPQWGNLPGYRESERALRAEHPHRYSDALYKTGRKIRGAMPLEVPVTVQTLRRLLNFLEETTKVEALANGPGRPRSITEQQALSELEKGARRLSLETWETIAIEAHRKYRDDRHAPYRDVVPEVLALACGVRLAYVHGIWQSTYNEATGVAQIAPRPDARAVAWDTLHEVAEALCIREGGTHADKQWVTVALAVERSAASAALRSHGMRGGVAALAKTHRRIRKCFLWVRLAMVASAEG